MGYRSFGEPHSANNYYNCANKYDICAAHPPGPQGFAHFNAMPPKKEVRNYEESWAAEIVDIRKVTAESQCAKLFYPHGWVEVQVAWQDIYGNSLGLQWQSLEHICDRG